MSHDRNRRILSWVLVLVASAAFLSGCATSGGGAKEPRYASPAGGEDLSPEQLARRASAHYNVGTGHLREGRVGLAIRELRIAEEMNPRDKWTQLALADAYRRKMRFADAEEHLLKGLAIDSDFQQASLTLSAIYIQLERYGEAIALTEMLVDDPTFPLPWAALTNQGWAYYKLGQLVPATEALEMATEYHSGYWRPVLSLGIIEAARGNSERAIKRFERVVELGPGPLAQAEANYRIAEIFIAQGNRGRAVEYLTASAAQRPSGTWGKRSEEYLDRLR
ncbi:MAG: tetratricopeptide repeat protein [Deltaproteobacteria bacterium]|nr:tetratricopeptide repeat protein [Deltaproteobacteria bacterium]MBW2395145.1 tetratricopeptide repeat protein [Deltaproteobacteria bacterium]